MCCKSAIEILPLGCDDILEFKIITCYHTYDLSCGKAINLDLKEHYCLLADINSFDLNILSPPLYRVNPYRPECTNERHGWIYNMHEAEVNMGNMRMDNTMSDPSYYSVCAHLTFQY